jgi:two-component system chemotaxis response regulator CheB
MADNIKVLIVDDTITYRMILSNIVKILDNVELVGQAQNGKIALEKVKSLKPDLVLLDIEMPEMDGIETLKKIREFNNEVEIIIISGVNPENAKKTLETLQHGALDFIAKATGKSQEDNVKHLVRIIKPLIDAVTIRKRTRQILENRPEKAKSSTETKPSAEIQKPRELRASPTKVDCVLIGISTGGPNALSEMIPTISPKLNCPVLIVQHMPPMFTKQLAERLNSIAGLPVKEAVDGDLPKAGEIYIAPGGVHMALKKSADGYIIRLVDSPPVNSCKPSVDVLFKSVPNDLHKKILTVIMTGMGNDGAAGVKHLRNNGAYSLIQDESSCTIFGMPAAVKNNRDYDEEIPLKEIGQKISQIVLKNDLY